MNLKKKNKTMDLSKRDIDKSTKLSQLSHFVKGTNTAKGQAILLALAKTKKLTNKQNRTNILQSSSKQIIQKLPISLKRKTVLTRRVNKLQKSPIIFIQDSYHKRSKEIKNFFAGKIVIERCYTIITPVYNAESTLNEFFESITHQTINFKKHIQLILIDDGSDDNSAAIIRKWKKRFPDNITYAYKPNGGSASARNLGLTKSKHEWITFIDADDFVSLDYFYQIDKNISRNPKLFSFFTNIHQYDSEKKQSDNTSPFKKNFSFKSELECIDFMNDDKRIILKSVCGAFFKKSIIESQGLIFNEKLNIMFEDTHFIINYLLSHHTQMTGLIRTATYYHRIPNKDPHISIWDTSDNLDSMVKEGLITLCSSAKLSFDRVPVNIQTVIIYYVLAILHKAIDNDILTKSFNIEQQNQIMSRLEELFAHIDSEVFFDYKYAGGTYANKIGLLNTFKDGETDFEQRGYVDSYDYNKKLFRVRYFSCSNNDLIFPKFDKKLFVCAHKKVIPHTLLNKVFVYEHILWIKIPQDEYIFSLYVNNKKIVLNFGSKRYKNIGVDRIKKFFDDTDSMKLLPEQQWFFIDSDLKADDNAEHLYRYVLNNSTMSKNQLIFSLNKTSHDWQRLEDEGFNLIDMQSDDAFAAMLSSDKIISSNASDYIMHFDGKNSLRNKNFVFLQHGVIHNDLSSWLKAKNIALFVTSTLDEYDSIVKGNSNYFFTEKEIQLTGQPRSDSLLSGNDTQKQILIMPTWRKYLVGKLLNSKTASRELRDDFIDTEYAQKWQSFLQSHELKTLCEQHGYEVVYFPHVNVQGYIDRFDIPEYINVVTHDIGSIQTLFQKAALMITDYSSVAFEMAYLNKQVIYYQFDEEQFLSGEHTSKPNYFKYRDHGFGPVVNDEESVVSELAKLLQNDAKPIEPFSKRIENTFYYRDSNNCQRVYESILKLDEPADNINLDILHDTIYQADELGLLNLVINYSKEMLQQLTLIENPKFDKNNYYQLLLNALYLQNKYDDVAEYCQQHDSDYWMAKIHLRTGYVAESLNYFNQNATKNVDEKLELLLLVILDVKNELTLTDNFKETLRNEKLNSIQKGLYFIADCVAESRHILALNKIDEMLQELSEKDKKYYKLELYACRICLKEQGLQSAYEYLVKYEKHTKDDVFCRLLIIELADKNANYAKVIKQYESVLKRIPLDVDIQTKTRYIFALCRVKQWKKLEQLLPDMYKKYNNHIIIGCYIEMLVAQKKWEQVNDVFSVNYNMVESGYLYEYMLTKLNLKQLDDLVTVCVKPTHDDDYKYWQLVAEIASATNNSKMLKYCLHGMVTIFPDQNIELHKSHLKLLLIN